MPATAEFREAKKAAYLGREPRGSLPLLLKEALGDLGAGHGQVGHVLRLPLPHVVAQLQPHQL